VSAVPAKLRPYGALCTTHDTRASTGATYMRRGSRSRRRGRGVGGRFGGRLPASRAVVNVLRPQNPQHTPTATRG